MLNVKGAPRCLPWVGKTHGPAWEGSMCWDGGTLGLAEKAAAQEEHMLLPASQFIHLLDPAIHVLTPNPWHTPQSSCLDSLGEEK